MKLDPSIVVALVALAGVVVAEWLRYRRGERSDQALDKRSAQTVTTHGLVALVEQLRLELNRSKVSLADLEQECHDMREENSELLDQIAATRQVLRAQDILIADLRLEVGALQSRVRQLEGTE